MDDKGRKVFEARLGAVGGRNLSVEILAHAEYIRHGKALGYSLATIHQVMQTEFALGCSYSRFCAAVRKHGILNRPAEPGDGAAANYDEELAAWELYESGEDRDE